MVRGPKILVISDHWDMLSLLERFLSGIGYQVATGPLGGPILQEARTFAPNAVLVDLLCGDRGEMEVLDLLRTDLFTHDIPIVVMAFELAPEEMKKVSKNCGITQVQTKFFNLDDLEKNIQAALEHSSS